MSIYNGQKVQVSLRDNGIAELCFNAVDGSVNKFDADTIRELSEAIAAISACAEVKGVLATSGKSVFIVGADLFGLSTLDEQGLLAFGKSNNDNLNALEDLDIPSVVAINGFALGGGFEFCMACDYRVISSAAQVGLPETGLSLIPGWGGTVRLPRLIGFAKAVDWVASGRNKKPQQALADGAVDLVAEPEELEAKALELLAKAIADNSDSQARKAQKKGPLSESKAEVTATAAAIREGLLKRPGKNYPAPFAALDGMEEAAQMGRDEALLIEGKGFSGVGSTPQARAMVGLFLNDQLLGKVAKGYAKAASGKVEQAAVLGAGIMGGGIAYQNALKGFPIIMKDIAEPALELGMSEAKKLLAKRVERGLAQEQADKMLARIKPTLEDDDVTSADMVVEAVVENPNIKASVLAAVEGQLADTAVLASNTSTISIDQLASNLKRPENFCGMHFFNPVHAMPLVEVIRGEKSSDETIGRVVAHAVALGKKPVVVKDCPGFLVNRVLFPAFVGCDQMIAEGVDFREIDRVLEGWGWPMGPAYLSDVVGIDTIIHALDVMHAGFPSRFPSSSSESPMKRLFDANRYGQKNGNGYYSYQADERGKPKRSVDEVVFDVMGQPGKTISDDEIVARFMLPMCTEMARCLEEGIVGSPAEADMALVYGLGFPAFRGGVFRWMDELGLAKICQMADDLALNGEGFDNELYQPTETMREMASTGKRYYR